MLPEKLRSLDKFEPQTDCLFKKNPQPHSTQALIGVQLQVNSWLEGFEEGIERVFAGTQQLLTLEELASRTVKNRKIETIKKALEENHFQAEAVYQELSRLDGLLHRVLGIRREQNFAHSTLRLSKEARQLTPSATAITISNFHLAFFGNAPRLLSAPQQILEEILLGTDDVTIFQAPIGVMHEKIPDYLESLVNRIFDELEKNEKLARMRVEELLTLFKSIPDYAYSFADFNDFQMLRDEMLQRIIVIDKLTIILEESLGDEMRTRFSRLKDLYDDLISRISFSTLNEMILEKITIDDGEELFLFASDWEHFQYPLNFRELGIYGDISDEEFESMSNKEAFIRCEKNLERLGLITFADFKKNHIYNSQMLKEFMARPQNRAKLNSLDFSGQPQALPPLPEALPLAEPQPEALPLAEPQPEALPLAEPQPEALPLAVVQPQSAAALQPQLHRAHALSTFQSAITAFFARFARR